MIVISDSCSINADFGPWWERVWHIRSCTFISPCSLLPLGACTRRLVRVFTVAWLVCVRYSRRGYRGGAVDRKPLKCFPICWADSADPDSQTPIAHWLIFPPSRSPGPPPHGSFFPSLCGPLVPRSWHRASSLMIPALPGSSPSPKTAQNSHLVELFHCFCLQLIKELRVQLLHQFVPIDPVGLVQEDLQ